MTIKKKLIPRAGEDVFVHDFLQFLQVQRACVQLNKLWFHTE